MEIEEGNKDARPEDDVRILPEPEAPSGKSTWTDAVVEPGWHVAGAGGVPYYYRFSDDETPEVKWSDKSMLYDRSSTPALLTSPTPPKLEEPGGAQLLARLQAPAPPPPALAEATTPEHMPDEGLPLYTDVEAMPSVTPNPNLNPQYP